MNKYSLVHSRLFCCNKPLIIGFHWRLPVHYRSTNSLILLPRGRHDSHRQIVRLRHQVSPHHNLILRKTRLCPFPCLHQPPLNRHHPFAHRGSKPPHIIPHLPQLSHAVRIQRRIHPLPIGLNHPRHLVAILFSLQLPVQRANPQHSQCLHQPVRQPGVEHLLHVPQNKATPQLLGEHHPVHALTPQFLPCSRQIAKYFSANARVLSSGSLSNTSCKSSSASWKRSIFI